MTQFHSHDLELSLLYVDDEPEARDILCSVIRIKFPGLRLHVAGDGQQGLALFRQHQPDIVLTDISMPLMDGIRMTGEIKALNAEVPIVFLTAHSDSRFLLDAIELGVSNYVMKPVNNRRLFAVLEKCIELITMKRQRKLAEQEIVQLTAQLEHRAQELESANQELEAFNYSVSHDLRRPLTNISGCCQVILELCGSQLSEQCHDFLNDIGHEIKRMDELISTLLQFARMGRVELRREPVDLSLLVRTLILEYQAREPDRPVSVVITEGVTVNGDPALLRIALGNLLSNAWKYTGKSASPSIEFGTTSIDGHPCCFVRDNGVGFDMRMAGEIFSPFQRLHGSQDFMGHGIGLATAQRIIARHHGRLWAQGAVGEGATFFFSL